MENIKIYNNGNYQVVIKEDGTKTRTTLDKEFKPKFPENIDINTSNFCTENCSFCYINASPQGKHGDMDALLELINNNSNTEFALNYAKNSGLQDILIRVVKTERQAKFTKKPIGTRVRGYICSIVNITVNELTLRDSEVHQEIQEYLDLGVIKGLGVSTNTGTKSTIKSDNIVYHVITGITPVSVIEKIVDRGDKVLVLGYKQLGRAESNTLPSMFEGKKLFKKLLSKPILGVISFDNLALAQLDIKSCVSTKVWKEHFMGEEGQFSMYYDLVTDTFSKSSTDREIKLKRNDRTVYDMFSIIRDIV
jgi:hypothetical protein